MKSIRIACLWSLAAAGLVYGQAPVITSVLDPYTGSTKLAPGGQAVITGTNLGLNPLVTVGGVNAFNLVPPQLGPQITIEIPVNAPLGTNIQVIVTTGAGGPSAPFNITLTQYAPVLINLTSGPLTSPRHQNSGVAVTASTPAAAGETIVFYAIGLGPTTPAVATGAVAASNTTTTNAAPTVTLGANTVSGATARLANGEAFFGASTSGPAVGNGQGFIAVYQVTFVVPAGTAAGSYPVSLSIGGATSNSVSLSVGPAPTVPVITAIVGETGKTALCPGDVAILSALNLGVTPPSVTVGGIAAFTINPNSGYQITIQIPVNAPLGAANVVLTLGTGQSSAPFSITLTQYAPVIPINGGTNLPFHLTSQTTVTAANPAVPGEQVGVVAYGLGPTNPVVPTGTLGPSNPSANTVTTPTVNIGGGQAPGVTAGLTNGQVGVYFVIFTVPQNQPAGGAPVSLSIGGLTSNLTTLQVFTGPVISNVTNAASNITAGLPNAGIAQGSIFTLFGTNLGPGTISIAQSAFQNTSLSGTSIGVTVGGTTVAPLMYYTSATQVSALLPSNTPVGTGTITVTYNGQVGLASPITVVQNNLGIFTYSQDGQGAGIVTNPDYTLVSVTRAANCGAPLTACGAANPGDTLVLWATGLGPVSNDAAVGVAINIPLTVWLGGVQAAVTYQGRGCCAGEDQINFVVPANVPTGCAVPLAVQIGNEISNYTVMPVAQTGSRTCTPSASFFTSNDVQQITTSSGVFNVGQIQLRRQPNYNAQGQLTGNTDTGKAQFFAFTVATAVQPFIVSYIDDLPPGTCAVYNNLNGGNNGGNYFNLITNLNAGTNIQVTGPNGSQTIPASGASGGRVTLSATGTYLSPGAYTLSGAGGADVGSFTTPFTIPTPPILESPVSGANINVTRANGLTLTWSGGAANSIIAISGENATNNSYTNGANFTCFADASAGTFTIPASVLLGLPPGNFGGVQFQPYSPYGAFSASGLNLGFIQMNYETDISTTFQ